MQRFILLALAGLVLATASAPTVAAESRVFNLTATSVDGKFVYLDENGEQNPDLNVVPGDDVLINLKVDGFHNIRFDKPVSKGTVVEKDTTQALRFTVPEDAPAEIGYWCDPHRGSGMRGVMVVEGGAPVDAGANATPAPGLALGVLAVAAAAGLVARHRVP